MPVCIARMPHGTDFRHAAAGVFRAHLSLRNGRVRVRSCCRPSSAALTDVAPSSTALTDDNPSSTALTDDNPTSAALADVAPSTALTDNAPSSSALPPCLSHLLNVRLAHAGRPAARHGTWYTAQRGQRVK